MKKQYLLLLTGCMAGMFFFAACGDNGGKEANEAEQKEPAMPKIKEDSVSYTVDGVNLKSYVYYDENTDSVRPAILVIPEWWGMTDYPKVRARQLASLGYIAMATDMYGNDTIAANPEVAKNLSGPFYANPQMAKARIVAALDHLKQFPVADTSKTGAIGYCFGGGMVLNAAKLGVPFEGVVSFHGNLAGVPANADSLKAAILVCHGLEDQFVSQEEVNKFDEEMKAIHADYTFKAYPGATHAFTNPDADKKAKEFNMPIAYNKAADTASWGEMTRFFERVFK